MSIRDDHEFDDLGLQLAHNSLEDICDQLETLREWAEDEGYRGISHKIEEGLGRIYNASSAALQYDAGELERRD